MVSLSQFFVKRCFAKFLLSAAIIFLLIFTLQMRRAKLSYAQMVQKGRENEENTADGKADDLSDNSGNESPQCSRMTLKALSEQFFSYIMVGTSYISMTSHDDGIHFVPTRFVGFFY
jgi:hypothetical protein